MFINLFPLIGIFQFGDESPTPSVQCQGPAGRSEKRQSHQGGTDS